VYNGFPGLNFRLASAGLYSGPNVDAPQNTFQSDKQFRYDGSWTKGAHLIRFGYSLNRILGSAYASFFGLAPRISLTASSVLANCGGVAGAAPCPSDPLNGYFASNAQMGNGQGYFSEHPGFKLPAGGLEDWRQGAYISDNWKVTPSFTLTAGLRWSIDTGRANQDLPTPLCSDVNPTLVTPPCSGNAPLLDQFQAGLGKKIHQPYANLGPQLGFAFSPGNHKTVFRAALGIFYESDVFNNTINARAGLLKQGLFNQFIAICGGTNTFTLPDGTVVADDGGVSIATICSEPLSQSGQHFINLQKRYQDATAASGPSANGNFVGNNLTVDGIYGAPTGRRTPNSGTPVSSARSSRAAFCRWTMSTTRR
jgi:hypothetical protein